MKPVTRPMVLILVFGLVLLPLFQNCGKSFDAKKIASSAPNKTIDPVVIEGVQLPTNFIRIQQMRGPYFGSASYAHLNLDMLAVPVVGTLDVYKQTPNQTGGLDETRCNMTFRLEPQNEEELFASLINIYYLEAKNQNIVSDGENPATRFVYKDCVSDCLPDDLIEVHNENDMSSEKVKHFSYGKDQFLLAIKHLLESQNMSLCPPNYTTLFQ